MPEKSLQASILLLLLLLATAVFPEAVFALGPPGPPSIFLMFELADQPVAAGCPATYIVHVISQAGFQGRVNLAVINPPEGVTATLKPNPVNVPVYMEAFSLLTVKIMPDTPQGKLNLTVRGVSADGKTSDTKTFTINVQPHCEQPPASEVKTTTVTTITTRSVTITSLTTATDTLTETVTNTSTEQTSDPSTLAWAISATVATIVLATVLFLQRRSGYYSSLS